MEEITDFQIKLLKVIDHVRWCEEEDLDGFRYHIIRRAVGQKDVIVELELKLAVEHMKIYQQNRFEVPPHGSVERSPWMESWDVSPERYHAAGTLLTPCGSPTRRARGPQTISSEPGSL